VDEPQASAAAGDHREVDYHRRSASSVAARPRREGGDGHYGRRNDYTPADQDRKERTHLSSWVRSIVVAADEIVTKAFRAYSDASVGRLVAVVVPEPFPAVTESRR
jgi:hypothetical protein